MQYPHPLTSRPSVLVSRKGSVILPRFFLFAPRSKKRLSLSLHLTSQLTISLFSILGHDGGVCGGVRFAISSNVRAEVQAFDISPPFLHYFEF